MSRCLSAVNFWDHANNNTTQQATAMKCTHILGNFKYPEYIPEDIANIMDPKFGCLMNIFSLFVFLSINSAFGFSISSRQIAPEITDSQKLGVKKILDLVYGDESSEEWNTRRSAARASGEEDNTLEIPRHELVYGELGLDALATVLDAVGVMKGDRFIDIGSGDGMLVSAASMLFPDYIDSSVGVEIVPDLHLRSVEFQNRLEAVLKTLGSKNHHSDGSDIELCPSTSLNLGNVYEPNESIYL